MSINLPDSADEIVSRSKTDVQRELTGSNPFLKNSWLGAIVTSFSNRIFDFYLQLVALQKEMFWNSSSDEFLKIQAAWFGITILPATQSNGFIVATGTATTSIPTGTEFKSQDGDKFLTTATIKISDQTINVSSITRSGSTVTVNTVSDHNLSSNVPVTIAGAVETGYNLTDVEIKVTSATSFTYQVSTTPTTPATGTITASFTSAQLPVQSVDFGSKVNLLNDVLLTSSSPIVGMDNDAGVDYGQIGGGADEETIPELRIRFFDRVQNPIAHFNVAEITFKAKQINGVTRVFVEEATPAEGQVTIYFMRDKDDNPIPTGAEVTAVKASIVEVMPANTGQVDVIVTAPTAVSTDYTFTALSPDTATMRSAIEENLKQFYREQTEIAVNIDEDAYRSIIFGSVDTDTGDVMSSFTLSAPSGDIVIASGEIGTLGSVVFP